MTSKPKVVEFKSLKNTVKGILVSYAVRYDKCIDN